MDQLVLLWATLSETSRVAITTSALIGVTAIAAATLAAIAAFVGVLITNAGHHKRLGIQLRADRDAKRLEREMSFRKEIYTDAFAAATEICDHAIAFANPKRDSNDIVDAMNLPRLKIGKVRLIGDEKTTKLAESFLLTASKYTSFAIDVHHKLRMVQLDVDSAQHRSTYLDEQLVLQSEVAEKLNNSNDNPEATVEAMERKQFWADAAVQQQSTTIQLLKDLQQDTKTAGGTLLPWFRDLNIAANDLLLSMRVELKTP